MPMDDAFLTIVDCKIHPTGKLSQVLAFLKLDRQFDASHVATSHNVTIRAGTAARRATLARRLLNHSRPEKRRTSGTEGPALRPRFVGMICQVPRPKAQPPWALGSD